MNWYIFTAIVMGLAYLFVKYRKIENLVKKIYKSINETQHTFSLHFKTTDATILEERKEKKYWKNRAIRAEKLLVD